jgi:outer membrane protein
MRVCSLKNAGKNLTVAAMALTMVFPVNVFAQQDAPQAPSAVAQQKTSITKPADFSRPTAHFPNPIGPYMAHDVKAPSFANTPRLDQLIKDGKLYLSLDDAIALALENNLDLAIARYNLDIADTDILRAKAGSGILGVASGLVSGTPGGGQGGFGTGASGAGAGGTTAGAGGAGAGSSGLVLSTAGGGPAIPQFDPSLNGSLEIEHAVFPLSNTVTTGVNVLQQNTGTANFSYNQGFAPGTLMSVGFNNNRQTTNSRGNAVNPNLNSSFRFTIQQHLLQGFGIALNKRNITVAYHNKQISDAGFKNQVISTVSQIQNIYWDLVTAYEDVAVKQRSLALAQKTESDNRKQVEIGTLAPIEIVRATSQVAARNQDLIISQTNLQLQQTLMINALTRNLSDPTLAKLPVIPTDTMALPQQETTLPIEDLVRKAIAQRPDLEQSRVDLQNREITRKASKNGLLPAIDIFGFYGASALGGAQNPLATCTTNCFPATSYGSTFGSLFDSSAPDKGVGLSINIPIRNRAAQAQQIRSELEFRQAQLRIQQQQNQVGIDVRNAQFALEQNRARVQAAQEGQRLAEQSLDAEQKKYTLGASTNTLVLQAQSDLAVAASTTLTAKSAYEKSRVQLDLITGSTLEDLGINLDDAAAGVVKTLPNVQGVQPAGQNPGNPPPPSTPNPSNN